MHRVRATVYCTASTQCRVSPQVWSGGQGGGRDQSVILYVYREDTHYWLQSTWFTWNCCLLGLEQVLGGTLVLHHGKSTCPGLLGGQKYTSSMQYMYIHLSAFYLGLHTVPFSPHNQHLTQPLSMITLTNFKYSSCLYSGRVCSFKDNLACLYNHAYILRARHPHILIIPQT